jgi:hypothetical protein
MAIPEGLNQHKLKEILISTYTSGMEAENIQVKDIIDEIKKQLLADSK